MALILGLSRLTMAPFFTGLGISFGLQRHAPRLASAFAHMARNILFVALVIHFVIPLSIYSTATAAHFFFHGQKEDIRNGFQSVHATTPKHDLGFGLRVQVKDVVRTSRSPREAFITEPVPFRV